MLNPMQSRLPMHRSPRCCAQTRSSTPCRGPAMKNGRCRMHGGRSPGAPAGSRNGRYRHGRYTGETRSLMVDVRRLRAVLAELFDAGGER
jgi:hypothetical protein